MLPGFKMLLVGPSGSGKTSALRTVPPEVEVFAIFTEPRYDVLPRDVLDRIHWRYIAPSTVDWRSLIDTAKQVNALTTDALTKISSTGGPQFQQLIDFYGLCNNFVDQNGQSFGDIANWGTDRLLWIDSLSGINDMVRKLKAGLRTTLSQPEWGICMTMIQQTVNTLATGLYCHLVLVGHVEREVDEVTGGLKLMVSTMGRKLAPTIPLNFSEVVLAKKSPSEGFLWSTNEAEVETKPCYLPLASKIPVNFGPVFDAWKARGGVLGEAPPQAWNKNK